MEAMSLSKSTADLLERLHDTQNESHQDPSGSKRPRRSGHSEPPSPDELSAPLLHPQKSARLAPMSTVANDDRADDRNSPRGQQTESSARLCTEALRALIDQRGLDVLGIELGAGSAVADYYVIASGTSQRHVRGLADKVRDALALLGERPLSESGFEKCDWLVIDYGNVVVHIFYEPVRQYYRLEEFLRSKPRVELSGELAEQADRLRTGMIS